MNYVYIITHPDIGGSVDMRFYWDEVDAERRCSELNESAASVGNGTDYEVEELKAV